MTNLNDNVGFWDSVLIENLTEETFISNIYQRYKRGLIYVSIGLFFPTPCLSMEIAFGFILAVSFWQLTLFQTYIGAFLVAINPYKAIANYSTDTIQCYAKSNFFKLPPHMWVLIKWLLCHELVNSSHLFVCFFLISSKLKLFALVMCIWNVRLFSYGITNSAYRSLQDQNENQCVCILGENGSGKTESARIILHFLSNVHSDHTLSGKKILHNKNSTRLMRCKSLATYPKYESPEAMCRSAKRDSIKFARKLHVSSFYRSTDKYIQWIKLLT